MSYACKKLDDEEIISYNMAELDVEYNLIVSSAMARRDPITVNNLFMQLLNFDMHLNLKTAHNNHGLHSVNAASRGGARGARTWRGGNQGVHSNSSTDGRLSTPGDNYNNK